MNVASANAITRPTARPRSVLREYVLSFEFTFALFLYSNNVKFFLNVYVPQLPVPDETLSALALSVVSGVLVIVRNGLYWPGFVTLLSGLAFFAWIAASWLWSPSRALARQEILVLFSAGLWSLAGSALIIASDRKRARRFLVLTAIFGIVSVPLMWHFYFQYGSVFGGDIWEKYSFSAVYQHWGRMAALGGLCALAISAFFPSSSLRTALFLCGAVIMLAFTVVSGSRVSLLASILGIVLILVSLLMEMSRRTLRSLTIMALLIGVGITTLVALEQAGYRLTSVDRFQIFDKNIVDNAYYAFDRPYYAKVAFDMWMQAPLTGMGVMSLSQYAFLAEISGTYPHNLIIQVAAETGLMGLGLLALFVIVSHRGLSIERFRHDRLYAALLVYSVVPWLIVLFSGSYAQYWWFYCALGLLSVSRPQAFGQGRSEERGGKGVRGSTVRRFTRVWH